MSLRDFVCYHRFCLCLCLCPCHVRDLGLDLCPGPDHDRHGIDCCQRRDQENDGWFDLSILNGIADCIGLCYGAYKVRTLD